MSGCRQRFAIGASLLLAAIALAPLGQTAPSDAPTKARKRADASEPADSAYRLSVEAARERAAQIHSILESTLHSMHRNYFHRDRDRATVPARAMQSIFADIAHDAHIDVHWIAVNTPAMSLDHEPADDFEKAAARHLATGNESFEKVDNGSFRRAGTIALGGSCVSCHTSSSVGPPSRSAKYAGLVISVPVKAP